MKTIYWYLHTGFAGCNHDGEIDVPDSASTDEIEELAKEAALNQITWGWHEKEQGEKDEDSGACDGNT